MIQAFYLLTGLIIYKHALSMFCVVEEFEFKDMCRSKNKKDYLLELSQNSCRIKGACLKVKHGIGLPASLASFEWDTGANGFGFNTADSILLKVNC